MTTSVISLFVDESARPKDPRGVALHYPMIRNQLARRSIVPVPLMSVRI